MHIDVRRLRAFAAAALAAALVPAATAGPAWAVGVTTLGPSLTPTDLANQLAGAGVTISNVTYVGSATSAGSFTGGAAAVGFAEGVVLSTGNADIGSANTSDSTTEYASLSGDADLDALGVGQTQDTTVLEFDVTPDQATLYFNYVFASEEYNEYVYSDVSDVFGFFVTTPGSATKQNCAVVPDGPDADADPDPVSIDTINGGNPYGDANASNSGLFRNNDLGDGGGSILAEPDGFTTVLQCVATVTPNQLNHLKLAISDVGDDAWDSWVFLQAESISTSPEICGDGIDNDKDGQVDEGCVVNQSPTVGAGGPYSGDEGSPIAISGTATDPDNDPLTPSWSWAAGAGVDAGATCTFGDASSLPTTVTCTDDGVYTLTLSASDGNHPAVTSTATLTVANVAPVVSITSPTDMSQVMTGANVAVAASLSDAGANDTHTCTIDWGDGSTTQGTVTNGVCSGSHAYATYGTYDVTVTATDDDNGKGSDTVTVVVADTETKVTGGGFVLDDGRYSFGFVAKSGPEGQLSVRTHANKNTFHGNTVSNLTVSGDTATWSGGGRYDKTAGYTFTVTVTDNGTGKKKGSPDTIDLTVRAPDGTVVLHFAGPLKGGNIKVH